MGMYCSLHRATEADIERLIAFPDEVRAFVDPDDGSAPPVREVRPKGLLGFILRLLPVTVTEVDPDFRPETAPANTRTDDRAVLDIEKDWHGLHFLFTGSADDGEEPACFMVRGGEPLDDDGYARALRPQQVRRFADFMSALSRAELERRYDPARMTALEIYPDVIWGRPASTGESPLDGLLASFTSLTEFVGAAAASGDGIIVHIA